MALPLRRYKSRHGEETGTAIGSPTYPSCAFSPVMSDDLIGASRDRGLVTTCQKVVRACPDQAEKESVMDNPAAIPPRQASERDRHNGAALALCPLTRRQPGTAEERPNCAVQVPAVDRHKLPFGLIVCGAIPGGCLPRDLPELHVGL